MTEIVVVSVQRGGGKVRVFLMEGRMTEIVVVSVQRRGGKVRVFLMEGRMNEILHGIIAKASRKLADAGVASGGSALEDKLWIIFRELNGLFYVSEKRKIKYGFNATRTLLGPQLRMWLTRE